MRGREGGEGGREGGEGGESEFIKHCYVRAMSP